jgi:hypothetical protein
MLWGLIVADPSKTKAGPAKPVVAVDRDGVKLTINVAEVTFMIGALAWVIGQVVDKMAWPLAYIQQQTDSSQGGRNYSLAFTDRMT